MPESHSGAWPNSLAKSLAHHAWAALACLSIAVGVESLNSVWRQADLEEAARENNNVALALAENALAEVGAANAVLDHAGELFTPYAMAGDYSKPAPDYAAILKRSGMAPGVLVQIASVDAYGTFRASSLALPKSPLTMTDRDHISVHLSKGSGPDPATEMPYVGKSVLGKISHAWTIQVSKRVSTPVGVTVGASVASLSVDSLHATYARIGLGQGSIISLIGSDGFARARVENGRPAPLSGPAPEASCKFDAAFCLVPDGENERRVLAARAPVGASGLSVVVAQGEWTVLADWRQRSALSRFFALIACACIGVLSWRTEKLSKARSATDTNKRASQDFAVGASKGKARFLNNLGQTLRPPAASIVSMSDLALADATLSPFARECIQSSKDSAKSLMGLLSKVSDMTAIESGRLALVKSRFDLGELVLLCMREAQASQDPPIEIVSEGLGSLPKDHWGDPSRVRQVLLELFEAARAVSTEAKLRASACLAGGHARIDIFALGSAPGALADPALQDPLSNDSLISEGLGLSLCSRLASLMDGDLDLSETEFGARLRLMLPLSTPKD